MAGCPDLLLLSLSCPLPCLLLLLITLATATTPGQEELVEGRDGEEVTEQEVEVTEEARRTPEGQTEYNVKVFWRMVTERVSFHPTPPVGVRFI